MKLEITFVYEKETPGTVRYKAEAAPGAEAVISTIYVKKSALGQGIPESLFVTVET